MLRPLFALQHLSVWVSSLTSFLTSESPRLFFVAMCFVCASQSDEYGECHAVVTLGSSKKPLQKRSKAVMVEFSIPYVNETPVPVSLSQDHGHGPDFAKLVHR